MGCLQRQLLAAVANLAAQKLIENQSKQIIHLLIDARQAAILASNCWAQFFKL